MKCKITIKNSLLQATLGGTTFDSVNALKSALEKSLIDERKAIPVQITYEKDGRTSKKLKMLQLKRVTTATGNATTIEIRVPNLDKGTEINKLKGADKLSAGEFHVTIPDNVSDDRSSVPDMDTIMTIWLGNYLVPSTKEEFQVAMKSLKNIIKDFNNPGRDWLKESPKFVKSIIGDNGIYDLYKSHVGKDEEIETLISDILSKIGEYEPVGGKYEGYNTGEDKAIIAEKKRLEFEKIQEGKEPILAGQIFKSYNVITNQDSDHNTREIGLQLLIKGVTDGVAKGQEFRVKLQPGSKSLSQPINFMKNEALTLEQVENDKALVGVVQMKVGEEWKDVFIKGKVNSESLLKEVELTTNESEAYSFKYRVGTENLSSPGLYFTYNGKDKEIVRAKVDTEEVSYHITGSGDSGIYVNMKDRGISLSKIYVETDPLSPLKGIPFLGSDYVQLDTLKPTDELYGEIQSLLEGQYTEVEATRVVDYLNEIIGVGQFSYSGRQLEAGSDLTKDIEITSRAIRFNPVKQGDVWKITSTVNRKKEGNKFVTIPEKERKAETGFGTRVQMGILAARINVPADEGAVSMYSDRLYYKDGLKSKTWTKEDQHDFIASKIKTRRSNVNGKAVLAEKYLLTAKAPALVAKKEPVVENVQTPVVSKPKKTLLATKEADVFDKLQTGLSDNSISLEDGLVWMKKVMPNAPVEIVDGLIEGVGRGSFNALSDLIKLSEQYADGKTVYHEVFHRAFAMLPNETKEKLLNEGSEKFSIERGESTQEIGDSVQYTGDLAIEEKMAEWSENELGKGYVAKNWFEKLLQDIWNWIKDKIVNPSEIEKLFRDINQGRIQDEVNLNEGEKFQTIETPTFKIPVSHLDMVASQILWDAGEFTRFVTGKLDTNAFVKVVLESDEVNPEFKNHFDYVKNEWFKGSNLFKLSEAKDDSDPDNATLDTKVGDDVKTGFEERTVQDKSSLELAGKFARVFFRTIPAVETKNGKVVMGEDYYQYKRDKDGNIIPADYTALWNTVSDMVVGALTINEIISKLENGFKKLPEVYIVIDRLKQLIPKNEDGSEGTPKIDNLMVLKSIEKSFAKMLVPTLLVLGNEKDGEFSYNVVSSGRLDGLNIANAVNTWFRKYANDNGLVEGGVLDHEAFYDLLLRRVGDLDWPNIESFWNEIGLVFPDMDERQERKVQSVVTSFTKAMLDKFKSLNGNEIKLTPDLFDIVKTTHQIKKFTSFGNRSAALRFQDTLAEVLPYATSNMTKNAEGENQSNLHNFSSWLLYIKYMNEGLHSKVARLKNPIAKFSLGLKASKAGKQILPVNISGTINQIKDDSSGTTSIAMNTLDYVRQEFHTLFLEGVKENIRAETASSSFGFKIEYENGKYLPIGMENVRERMVDTYWGYFQGEIERIFLETKQPTEYGARFYNANKGGFTFFSGIIGKEGQDKLIELIDKMENISEINTLFTPAYKASLGKYLNAYFDNEVKEFKQWLLEEGGVQVDDQHPIFKTAQMKELIKNYGVDKLIDAFMVNGITMAWEEVIMFHGEIGHFDKFYKRSKSSISNGTPMVISDMTQRFLDETKDKASFSALDGFTPNYLVDASKMTSMILAEDKMVMDPSQEENWRPILEASIKATGDFFGKTPNVQKQVDKIISGYKDKPADVSDGDAKIHPDAYRLISIGVDSWSYEKEMGFRYLIFKEKIARGFILSKEEQAFFDMVTKKIEKEGYFFQFPKLKFQYRGNATKNKTNVAVELLDKFALQGLWPDLIKGKPKAEALYKQMTKEGVAYVKFQSGTKIGTYGADSLVDLIENVKKGDYKLESLHEIESVYLKEQVKTPDKIKDKGIFGSQPRKLMISNLSFNGIVIPQIQEAKELWQTSQADLAEYEKKKLITDLGGDPESDNPSIDLEVLVDMIREELSTRDVPESYSYLFEDFQESDLMEMSLSPQIVQTIIYSLLKNRIVKVKYPGGQFVQVSSALMDTGNERDLKNYREENGVILPADCKITLSGDFLNLLNLKEVKEKGGTRETLNELLLDQEFRNKYKKELTIFAYRIPNQGYNSNDILMVQEFLPEYMGNTIVTNPQIVVKSGTDYDYDKMNVVSPSLGKDGRYISNPSKVPFEQMYDKLYKDFAHQAEIANSDVFQKAFGMLEGEDLLEVIDSKLVKDGKLITKEEFVGKMWGKLYKKSKYNETIEAAQGILLNPINFHRLITPNSTDEIVEALDKVLVELYDLKPVDGKYPKVNPDPTLTRVMSMVQSYKKWDAVKCKDLLGIGAVANTFYTLMQNANFQFKEEEGVSQMIINKVPFFFKVPLLSKEDQQQVNISDAFVISQEVIDKLEYINQFINLTVDAASNDIAGYTNMKIDNTGFILFQVMLGVPFEQILRFIHQPIIYKYHQIINVELAGGASRADAQKTAYEKLLGIELTTVNKGGYVQPKSSEKIWQEIRQIGYPDEIQLKRLVPKSKISEVTEFTKEDKEYLVYYLVGLEQASALREVQGFNSFDTGTAPNYKLSQHNENPKKIEKRGLFSMESVFDIHNKSVISHLNVHKEFGILTNAAFPIKDLHTWVERVAALSQEVYSDPEKFIRVLDNDFLLFIVQNFSNYDSKRPYYISQLENGKLMNRWADLVSENPELKDTNLFKKLVEDPSKTSNLVNPMFFMGMDNSSDDFNLIINELRDMLKNPKTEAWTKDFLEIGFFQSGYNQSKHYMLKGFPPEFIQAMVGPAFHKFNELSRNQKSEECKRFFNKFLENRVLEFGKFFRSYYGDFNALDKAKESFNMDTYRMMNYLTPRVADFIQEPESKNIPVKGINIKSDKTAPNSLANRLTNPNWYARGLYDVETEYKANQSKKKAPKLNKDDALKYDMNLMYSLQVKKFKQNPELIDEINEQGGLEFIKNSSHVVGVKGSRWEGVGMESNFIKVLAKSYETVSKELGKFKETSQEFTEFEEVPNQTDVQIEDNLTQQQYKDMLLRPFKGFENGLWYYFAEKAKEYAPEKYDSIVNAKDYHTAYLIGADRSKAFKAGKSSTPGIQDPGDVVFNRVIKEITFQDDFLAVSENIQSKIDSAQDDYLYYGTWYKITVEGGKGIDVVGYKGKTAAKNKLLEAYNTNPNIDVQSGKSFRTTQAVTTNDSRVLLFTKDGKDYYLNEDQEKAYHGIKSFLKSRLKSTGIQEEGSTEFNSPLAKEYSGIIPKAMWNNMIGLVGKGGVGKTSTVGKIIEDTIQEMRKEKIWISDESILYAAPTHNAVTMLQEALDINSEGTDGVKTLDSMIQKNQKPGSENAKKGKADDVVWLLSDEKYTEMLEKGFIQPLIYKKIIVIDESSMVGKEFFNNLMDRIKLEQEFYKTDTLPLFIFMGDYRQLPPVESDKQRSSFSEGIISATLFSDTSKFYELSQVMRSKSLFFHGIFNSIGDQISQQRIDFNEGKAIKPFDNTEYDRLTSESTNDLLVVNESEVDSVIEDYVNILSEQDNPYEIFWVHYNAVSREETVSMAEKIRKAYFQKLGTPYTSDITVGDYIEYKGNFPMFTEIDKDLNIDKGTIKPRARVKVLEVYPENTVLGPELSKHFGQLTVNTMVYKIFNRQGKERIIRIYEKGTFEIGSYDNSTKQISLSIKDSSGKIHTKGVNYRAYKESLQNIFANNSRSLDELFVPSYIGSSHTVQGAGYGKVIVGDYNIRMNGPKIALRDMESSWYVSLTRAVSKLAIIKPNGIPIKNNRFVFSWNDVKVSDAVSPITEEKETDQCSFGASDNHEIPF